MRFTIMLIVTLILSPMSVAHQIEVQALFGGAALLSIDGHKTMLKVGQRSKEGVVLISADATMAVVEYDGKEETVLLSDRIGSNFVAPTRAQVMISKNDNQQYLTHGSINGRPVRFLVDTGANVVAINSTVAASLGLSVADGEKSFASTASARTAVTVVTIKEMQVGPIMQSNVRAVIFEGEHPKDILLGMTFLQHVDISENAGLMVLTSKL